MSTVTNIGSADLAYLTSKARDAASAGISGLSTGEKLAVALILDRPDWLAALDCSIAEAIERVGPDWLRLIPAVARQLNREREDAAYAAAEQSRANRLAQLASDGASDSVIELAAKLVTYGEAPGYRDVQLTFDLDAIGSTSSSTVRAAVHINPQDGEEIARIIKGAHRRAWSRESRLPLDGQPGETRPSWID
nr:hypothetical protein [uncultured Ralstonia sp.]